MKIANANANWVRFEAKNVCARIVWNNFYLHHLGYLDVHASKYAKNDDIEFA